MGLIRDFEIKEVIDTSGDNPKTTRSIKFRFADRIRILELIGKHTKVQAFTQKLEPDAPNPLQELYRQIQDTAIRPVPYPTDN